MSDTTTEVVETEPTTETAPAGEAEETSTTPAEGEEATDGEDIESLPEWAKKALEKARNDAAHRRTQLKDLQTKYEGAKSPEEVAAITEELGKENVALAREVAIEKAKRTHGLTDAHDVFLTGTTAEDIEKQAIALKELAAKAAPPPPAVDPAHVRGGLTPKEGDPEPTDPRSIVQKYGRRR